MTTEQLNEGNRLRREVRYERDHLRRQQFDVEMGGRRGEYATQESLSHSDDRANDMKSIANTEKRIEALKAKFAAL